MSAALDLSKSMRAALVALVALPISAAFAESAEGSPVAVATETLPSEPFAPPAPPPSVEETSVAEDTPPENVSPETPGRKGWWSLEDSGVTDLFTRVFDLFTPGAPNSRDKLRLTLATTVGYDDNVFTTHTDPIGSGTAGLSGSLAYNFGSERLQLATSLSLGTTYYDNRPGDATDYNGAFSATTTYLVNRRLTVAAGVSIAYLSQPNPTLIGGVSRFSGDYIAANGNIDIRYSLRPRLAIHAGYRGSLIQYTEESVNQNLGFTDQSYVIGLDYLFSPRITLTAEYRYNPLTYYESDQGSDGHIFTFGFTTTLTPKFNWVLQAGAEARVLQSTSTQEGPSQYIGPFLETNVSYGFAPQSSLTGSIRYGTEPSGVSGISVRQTLRGALTFRYAFGGRLSTDLGISYEHDSYDQPGATPDTTQVYYTGSLGLRYEFNPSIALTARYEYSAVQTEQQSEEYNRGVSTLGLEILF